MTRPNKSNSSLPTGRMIPGGCDGCDAYQTITSTPVGWRILVHHDSWCPLLAAHERRQTR